MLWKLFVALTILWMVGMATAFTLHGFIHLLLGGAAILVTLLINQDRKSFPKIRNDRGRARWRR